MKNFKQTIFYEDKKEWSFIILISIALGFFSTFEDEEHPSFIGENEFGILSLLVTVITLYATFSYYFCQSLEKFVNNHKNADKGIVSKMLRTNKSNIKCEIIFLTVLFVVLIIKNLNTNLIQDNLQLINFLSYSYIIFCFLSFIFFLTESCVTWLEISSDNMKHDID